MRSTKRGRDDSVRAEQDFCYEALESEAYDSMSDSEWVALCEQVATEARQAAEQDDGPCGRSKHAAKHEEARP